MVNCHVPGCNRSKTYDLTVSYHKVPRNEALREKWTTNMKIGKVSIGSTMVCSRHFEPDCFNANLTEKERRRLKNTAVPTLLFDPEPRRYRTDRIKNQTSPKQDKKFNRPRKIRKEDYEHLFEDSSWDDDTDGTSVTSSDGEPIPFEEFVQDDFKDPNIKTESVFIETLPSDASFVHNQDDDDDAPSLLPSYDDRDDDEVSGSQVTMVLTKAQQLLQWAISREKSQKHYIEQAKDAFEKFIPDDEMDVQETAVKPRDDEGLVSTKKLLARIDKIEVKTAVNTAIWRLATQEVRDVKESLVCGIDCREFAKVADILPAIPIRSVRDLKLLETILEGSEEARTVVRYLYDGTGIEIRTFYSFILTNLKKILTEDCIIDCTWTGVKDLNPNAYFDLEGTQIVTILVESAQPFFNPTELKDTKRYIRKALYNSHQQLREDVPYFNPIKLSYQKVMKKIEKDRERERKAKEDDNEIVFEDFMELEVECERLDLVEEADWVKNMPG